MVSQQLGGDAIKQMSRIIGADEESTGSAVQSALPLLIGALARNSSNDEGASSLASALNKDHDGSILDNLGGFLGNAGEGPGDGILRHVLGDKRQAVEMGLSKTSGLDSGSAGKLLAMLAPIVMGALGRAQRQQGFDVGGLTSFLGNEREQVEGNASPALGMLTRMLDSDGDGQIIDDIAGMGAGFLGDLFGKKS